MTQKSPEANNYDAKLKEEGHTLLTATLLANLKLSVEERIRAHENARRLMNELQIAGANARAGSR